MEFIWIFKGDERFAGVIEAKIGDDYSFEYLRRMGYIEQVLCVLYSACVYVLYVLGKIYQQMNCTIILLCIWSLFTKGIMLIRFML